MQEQRGDERIMQAHMAERTESPLAWVEMGEHGPLGPHGPEEIFERLAAPPLSINWYFGNALAEYAQGPGFRPCSTAKTAMAAWAAAGCSWPICS